MTGTPFKPSLIPDVVPASAHDEIARFADRLPDGFSCLVTGSLVEGIGNVHSDVDLYVLQPAGARSRPISIGIRGARYVDCEYFAVEVISQLADRMQDEGADALLGLSERDFNRYYRIAIGIPLVTTGDAVEVLRRCRRERACARYAQWSAVRAHEHLARAAVAHAFGQTRRARLLLRETALWRATHLLAAAGEGYPSLKWTGVKASRRFPAGSAQYHACLEGYERSFEDVAAELERMRALVAVPEAVLAAVSRHPVQLGGEVTVVGDGEDRYLLNGRRTIARAPGLLSRIVGELARGDHWPHAARRVAAGLSLPTGEVIAAARADLRYLQEVGYLVPRTGATAPASGRDAR
jgi:hypothetical protein